MNDRRFIELLNLYVDQELSPDQARELEQEISHRPERRRIYNQYCRMQRACVRLLEQQAAPAPRIEELKTAARAATAPEPLTVIHLPSDEAFRSANRGRRGLIWMTWSSGLVATAACVALALVLSRQPGGPAVSPGAVASSPSAQPAPEATMGATAAYVSTETPTAARSVGSERAPSYRSVLVLTDLQRGNSDQFVGSPANTLSQPSLDWLIERRLTPIRRLPLEPYPYDVHSPLSSDSAPLFVNERVDTSVPAESITFEFRR